MSFGKKSGTLEEKSGALEKFLREFCPKVTEKFPKLTE